MNLYTPVELATGLPRLKHSDRLMLLGSCFATHIGAKLADAKFCCDVNPYGTLYNPLSISAVLHEVKEGKPYTQDHLFLYRDCWHSPMHHGDFSSAEALDSVQRINERLLKAHNQLPQLDYLLLTFGTAWVYEDRVTRHIVGNCHKQPEAKFIRRKLTVEEIVLEYKSLLAGLLQQNPKLKVLFTVSPIRHVRDGMHANQLSKATLLLAIEELQASFPAFVFYFPAYELLMDELRDYRFYADDMVHPSSVGISYIWERFVETCISADALHIMEESENIRKALLHKPFYPGSEAHKCFLEQIVLKIDQLNGKYPYLDFKKERDICRIQLKA